MLSFADVIKILIEVADEDEPEPEDLNEFLQELIEAGEQNPQEPFLGIDF